MDILSQRDGKWASEKLGYGNTTIHDYGCTITAIAMLAGLTPSEVNERLKKVGGFTNYDNKNLVIWSKIQEAIPWLKHKVRSTTYNNDAVKQAISQSGGCLVEVNGSRIGASKHWVLYVGGGQMHDPWFGTKKTTSYYPAIGYSTIERIGEKPVEKPPEKEPTPEPSSDLLDFLGMPSDEEAKKKLIEHLGEKDGKIAWGDDRGAGYLGQEREKNRVLTGYLEENGKLKQTITELENEVADIRGTNTSLKTSYANIQKKYNDLISYLAKKLGTSADESGIDGEIERLVTSESDMAKKASDLQKAMDEQESGYKDEIETLKAEIKSQNEQLARMVKQNENLLQRVEDLEAQKETTKRINLVIADIINFFKRS